MAKVCTQRRVENKYRLNLTTIMIGRSGGADVGVPDIWVAQVLVLRQPVAAASPVSAAGRVFAGRSHSMLDHLTLESDIWKTI
jgi:hypothetical protein